ncbi:MAG: hypothetical protein HYR60_09305 [Acidobacteria bacterium]|nr:hypothetical protein [Acidobacteriota bacterium]
MNRRRGGPPGLPAALLLAALAGGCGYVGEPLPPLLNIPARVTDLSAVEHGAKIQIRFTTPKLTTEGMVLAKPARVELRLGPRGEGFNPDAWAAAAQLVEGLEVDARPWVGKEIVIGVRVTSANGRTAGWSNFVEMRVIPPLATPVEVRAEGASQGVRVTWKAPAERYRVLRSFGETESAGEVEGREWIDTAAEYGKHYQYRVQAIEGTAESEVSEAAGITLRDTFPPAVPAGLTVVAGTDSIELAWEPNAEADLAGYRVYRAPGEGGFELLGGIQENPAYSDRKAESGRRYRYAVSAVDRAGNESPRSAAVENTAP